MYGFAGGYNPLRLGMGATTTVPASKIAFSAAASALLTAAAVTPPPANAILAAAAGIAATLGALGVGEGCGSTCVQATSIVNQAEPAFLANVQQYERGEITAEQAQQTWGNLWQAVETSCAAIPGAAGQDCVSDRADGACKWRQTSTSPLLGLPGEPEEGECWNWKSGYFDPLTHPPVNVPAESSALVSDSGSILSSVGISGSLAAPLLIGAAVLVGWLVIR